MPLNKKDDAKRQREKYRKNKAYREEKKEDRLKYAKTHKKQEREQSREYYKENADYRRKKIEQAKKNNKKYGFELFKTGSIVEVY